MADGTSKHTFISHYKSDHKYRGRALIIVNENFDYLENKRDGALQDINNMAYMFRALDFKVTVFKDLKAKEMMEKIREAATDPINVDCDCFALVISSHGEKVSDRIVHDGSECAEVWRHGIFGTDMGQIYVDQIMHCVEETKASGLTNKPKLFFIQVCRSQKLVEDQKMLSEVFDIGMCLKVLNCKPKSHSPKSCLPASTDSEYVDVNHDWIQVYEHEYNWQENRDHCYKSSVNECDAKGAVGLVTDDIRPVPVDIVPNECAQDCLIVYPVMSGKYAFRGKECGSFLLYYLYKNASKLLDGCGFMEYLTHVVSDIGKHDYEYKTRTYKMPACIVHRLTADVRFKPKLPNSYMASVIKNNKSTVQSDKF